VVGAAADADGGAAPVPRDVGDVVARHLVLAVQGNHQAAVLCGPLGSWSEKKSGSLNSGSGPKEGKMIRLQLLLLSFKFYFAKLNKK
jgi:hypothetical protein